MRRLWPIALLLLVGCSKPSPETPGGNASDGSPSADPARTVYDQVRSGFIQLGNSLESLGGALEVAKEGQNASDSKLKEICKEIGNLLDSAGSYLSDYTEPPETFEAFNEKFAEHDDNRLKAIDGANDALHEIDEAKGFLSDLQNDPKLDKEQIVLDLTDLITDAEKSLREAIPTLGGKVEEPGAF